MYDISQRDQRSDRLFEVLCQLQYNLRNSTSNFHVKLFCLKIYHMLGCVLGAQEMYDSLDIKQIQMDSMGFAHCGLMVLTGRFSMARVLYDATLKFFTGCFKDRLDYLALTYRFSSFWKVEEFMDFKDRLTNSYHFTAVSVEAQLCDLVLLYGNVQQNLNTYTMMNIDPAEDRINWEKLRDNRDLDAILQWDPVHLLDIEHDRQESFAQELDVLRIRSLMLRLMAAMVNLYHPSLGSKSVKSTTAASKPKITTSSSSIESSNDLQNHKSDLFSNSSSSNLMIPELSILENLLESWNELFKRITEMNYKPLSNRFLVNLLPTRLHVLLRVPYESFFRNLAELVSQFYWGDSKLPMKCKEICDQVTDLANMCSNTINDCIKVTQDLEADGFWQRREWQATVAACFEVNIIHINILLIYKVNLYL